MAALWEQWEDEPPKAFAAFTIFRDLPPATRSLPQAYRTGMADATKQKASGQWRQWAELYQWIERATAYDGYLDAVRVRAAAAETKRLAKQHVRQIEISARAALEENAALAHSNIADLVEWDESGVRVKPSADLPPHVTAAVAKVSMVHDKLGNPNVTVEMHPKVRPIDLEGQHFQLWESDKKQAEKAATNNFLELLAAMKSGKFDEIVETMKPSLRNPPPGITITRNAPLTVDDLEKEKAKDEY